MFSVVSSPCLNYHITKYQGKFVLRLWEPASLDHLKGKPFLWMVHQHFVTSSEALAWVEAYEALHGIKARYSPLLVSFAIASSTKLISDRPIPLRERRLHSTARIHWVYRQRQKHRALA